MSTFLLLITTITISNSQTRTFEGITLEQGTEVHIDFRLNNQWNRYQVLTNEGAPITYTTDINQNGDKYTWIYTEGGGGGMRFESIQHSNYYLAIPPTPMAQIYFLVLLNQDAFSISTYGEWVPDPVSGSNVWTLLKSTYSEPRPFPMPYTYEPGCVHTENGGVLQLDPECDKSGGTSRRIRIVPRFPCSPGYMTDILGWYNGLSVDLNSNSWQNMMNKGDDINLDSGNSFVMKNTNSHPYLRGFKADEIIFPISLPTEAWIALFVTRYQSTNQERIIECKNSDCSVGHKDGYVGILYQDGQWITSQTSYNNPTMWLVSTAKISYYRANDYDVPTPITPTHTVNDQFCINCYGTKSSDFDVAEVIIITKSIVLSNAQCIEDWLINRYNIPRGSKDPTPAPTNNPTPAPSNKPTLGPTDNPTPAPTDCVGNTYVVVDTTTLTEWTKHADSETLQSDTIQIVNDAINCYGTNPCIKVVGIAGTLQIGRIYIEKIFDTTTWNDITLNVEAKTNLLETNEKGFIETVCNADTPQITTFNDGTTTGTHYSGCLYLDTTSCDSVTLRIGGYLSGTADYLYIAQILLQYTTSKPTTDPTNDPTKDPTTDPTTDPTKDPTTDPTKDPTNDPTKDPTKDPTTDPTTDPTKDPTNDPTTDPTKDPTTDPSSSPSQPPSNAPSTAPTYAPTICLDHDSGYNSNDGANEIDVQQIVNNVEDGSSFTDYITADSTAHLITRPIYLNATKYELKCSGLVACLQSPIYCPSDHSNCNILCDGELSCSEAIIYANNTDNVHIICNGKESCRNTKVYAENIATQVIIDCVSSLNCASMSISLQNNSNNEISCYLPNSCDDINIFTTNYEDTKIKLYSYSNNIVYDNGYGLEIDDQHIDCNIDNKYIRYDSSLKNDANTLHQLIANEYKMDNLFPCNNNIKIKCDRNSTDTVDNICSVTYSLQSISTPLSSPQCYWVSIKDLIKIQCPGTCITSPTSPPTSSPSMAPTLTTFAPSDAPSFSPSTNPSSSPSQPPSISPSASPSQPPTNIPSMPPTAAPSVAPSISPTLNPSFSPTSTPSFSPSSSPSASPTTVPSVAPSNTPTQPPSNNPTQPPSFSPSNNPSSNPSMPPTAAPSVVPSMSPTLNPSLSPSFNPSTNPSTSPTIAPSIAPTNSPTNNPSRSPSIAPTLSPSFSPSNNPSRSPSLDPTIAPTDSPTNNPSMAPTRVPTNSPTRVPTNSPTVSPSMAPTRVPTEPKSFGVWIDLIYQIQHYAEENLYFITNDSVSFVERIEEILERQYFPSVNSYSKYAVYILKINQVEITRKGYINPNHQINDNDDTQRRRRLQQDDDDNDDSIEIDLEIDDLYSYQLQQPITLTSQILAIDTYIGGAIMTRTDDAFMDDVQQEMRDYFGNNDIEFSLYGEPVLLEEVKTKEEETDWTAAYISFVAVFIGLCVGIGAFIVNQKKNSWVDNAAFLAPILVGLQIYDLISDFNLSYSILTSKLVINDVSTSNPYFLCGVASLVFTILPFISNIYYGMTLPQQKVIKNNTAASAYFKNRLTEFVLIVVFTGGCFPALALVSSRIYALEIFNSGLTKYELNKLAKIKIRSTITLENGPQLLVQIIYTTLTGDITTATALAFFASLLSVIATLATFYAQSNQNKSEDNVVVQYALYFGLKDQTQVLDKKESSSINQRKERKKHLSRDICSLYQIPHESIEIGFVKIVSNGCIMNIVHHVFKEQLKQFQKSMNIKNNHNLRGVNVQIDPQYFTQKIYKMHKTALNNIICNHFQLEQSQRFIVQYISDDIDDDIKYSNDNINIHNNNNKNNMVQKVSMLARNSILNAFHDNNTLQEVLSDEPSDSDNDGDDEEKVNTSIDIELTPLNNNNNDSTSINNNIQMILQMQNQQIAEIQKQTQRQIKQQTKITQSKIEEIQKQTQQQILQLLKILDNDDEGVQPTETTNNELLDTAD